MTELCLIPIENIRRRPDARPRTDEALNALAESINEVGLISPIRVRLVDDGYEATAGSHRLQACDLLGWSEVPCIIVDDDDLHAELAMIDENLCRAELSPADRAKQTARRKAIYLELHPETAHGGDRTEPSRQVGDLPKSERFTEATAKVTGQSERAVQRDAERGEKVIDAAIDLIRGTKLDTGTYLDKLKRLSPSEQVHAARRDLAFEKRRTKGPKPRGAIGARFQPADVVSDPLKSAERFIWLADQIEAIEVDDLVSSGRMRATVGQRAEGVAMHMDEIKERLNG